MQRLTDEMIEEALKATGLRLQPRVTLDLEKGLCCPIGACAHHLNPGREYNNAAPNAADGLGLSTLYRMGVVEGFDNDNGSHAGLPGHWIESPDFMDGLALGSRWRDRWRGKAPSPPTKPERT